MPRTLFICDEEEHPVHEGFAESIGADFYRYTIPDYIHKQNWISRALDLRRGIKLPDYDVYLATGLSIPIIKKIVKQRNKPKIIHLAASSYYSRLTLGIPRTIPRYEKPVIKQLFRFVDGIIAISEFVKEEISKVTDCPVEIVPPFIDPILYSRLFSLKPNLDGHIIVVVGKRRGTIDIMTLIKAFEIVKKEFKDCELYIIGAGHSKELEKFNGIHVTGWVDDLSPFLQKSSLFAFPGYGQAFYLGVVEAMCAGLPALVSRYTGAKDAVKRLDKKFIRDITPEDFAKRIIWYFDLPLDDKKWYSEKSKEISKEFTKERKCREFREKFELLLEKIG